MNIPNDGGWGKPPEGQGSGLLGRFLQLPNKWLMLAAVVLTASLSFGTGLLAAKENQPPKDGLWIEQLPAEELQGSVGTSTSMQPEVKTQPVEASQPAAAAAAVPKNGTYVASKTGKKYYLSTCAGAKRIKEANRVWFANTQEAEAAGYQPAATCKGI